MLIYWNQYTIVERRYWDWGLSPVKVVFSVKGNPHIPILFKITNNKIVFFIDIISLTQYNYMQYHPHKICRPTVTRLFIKTSPFKVICPCSVTATGYVIWHHREVISLILRDTFILFLVTTFKEPIRWKLSEVRYHNIICNPRCISVNRRSNDIRGWFQV